MPQTQTYCICDAHVIAADGAANDFPITDSGELMRFDGWSQITFLVKADVGGGVEAVAFAAQVAVKEDSDWFGVPVHDLTNVGAAKDLQVPNVTIAADVMGDALIAIVDSVPFVRLRITNNGANPATVTVWAVVV